MQEDGRLTELLSEADDLSDREPDAAARNLREVVLPRAIANQRAVAALTPRHPRAQQLTREMLRLTDDRVETVQAYAAALANRDVAAQRDVVHRQAELESAVLRVQQGIDAAAREPASGGCAVVPSRWGR